MKQTIIPVSRTYKPTKSGVAKWEVEDNQRFIYSVWDEEIVKKLEPNVACDVEVTDSKDGKYKTIREFYAAGPGAEARASPTYGGEYISTAPKQGFQKQDVKPERVETPITDKLMNGLDKPSKDNEKTACVLLSYAKDMWVAAEGKQALKQYLEPVVDAYKLALEKL